MNFLECLLVVAIMLLPSIGFGVVCVLQDWNRPERER